MGFTWSYSKFKNYHTCPKRHYEVDIAKNYTETSEQLTWGNEVHKHIAEACKGAALPASMVGYQEWVDRYADPGLPGKLEVELKFALTKDFQPTKYFGSDVWYRGICDLLRVYGPVASAVDWKTGAIPRGGSDSRQLMLMAQCIFAHYPEVKRVKTEFVWLKDDCTTPEVFNRDTILNEWPPLLEGVSAMEKAARDQSYPPKPGGLCRSYCPVVSCTHNGKR